MTNPATRSAETPETPGAQSGPRPALQSWPLDGVLYRIFSRGMRYQANGEQIALDERDEAYAEIKRRIRALENHEEALYGNQS